MNNDIFSSEIEIINLEDGRIILLLICPVEIVAFYIADMLDTHKYKINCYTKDYNNISIGILFELLGNILELRIKTAKNRINYLPIDWLFANKVKFIATGWINIEKELFYTSEMPLTDLTFIPMDNL